MNRLIRMVCQLVLLFTLCDAALAQAINIKRARVAEYPDKVRIVLDLSGTTTYKAHVMQGPERLVVDIANAWLTVDLTDISLKQTIVKRIRSADHSKFYRLVFDLRRSAEVTTFALAPNELHGNRIVIDLKPSAHFKPLQSSHALTPSENHMVNQFVQGAAQKSPSGHSGKQKLDARARLDEARQKMIEAKDKLTHIVQKPFKEYWPERKLHTQQSPASQAARNQSAAKHPPTAQHKKPHKIPHLAEVVTATPATVLADVPALADVPNPHHLERAVRVLPSVPAHHQQGAALPDQATVKPLSQALPQRCAATKPTLTHNAKMQPRRVVSQTKHAVPSQNKPAAKHKSRMVTSSHVTGTHKPVRVHQPAKIAHTKPTPKRVVKPAKGQSKLVLPRLPARSRDIIVVIDPGHGGKDSGAVGPTGAYEKNIVLAISKVLQQQLNAYPGIRARLTRQGDFYIPLRTRMRKARKFKADVFVAVHADAFNDPHSHGASVFALSDRGASSEAARWLAEKENYSELGKVSLGDKDRLLRKVLISLSQDVTNKDSLKLGSNVIDSLGRVGKLHHNKVEQAPFVVLKSPDIPSILVETGFISNPTEERQLRSGPYQRRIAKAIASGIEKYLKSHPPEGTTLYHARMRGKKHVVKGGESLTVIANRYQVSAYRLRLANLLKNSIVRAGDKLYIPSRAADYASTGQPTLPHHA